MLLKYLAKLLLLDEGYILSVADNSNSSYGKFSISKKGGGNRIIYKPNNELKVLQRVLHENVLSKIPVHSCAKAYQKGSSIVAHALNHNNKKFLLKMDFESFFDSIKESDVRDFIDERCDLIDVDWDDADTDLLVKLVCFNGRLTMGAVTSPLISNAICYQLDVKLNDYCLAKGITYTRYADDIYFSTNERNLLKYLPSYVKGCLKTINYPKKLWLNSRKTIHSSRKKKMMVTGIILKPTGGISIGREKKREVRSLIFNWKNLSLDQKMYLQGYLAYCKGVEPAFINNLCTKYTSQVIDDIQRFS